MSEKASVKLSTKSWHYKLIKFILGGIAPTPENMFNLCPYFWLLVFSLLVTPIVAPIKLILMGFVRMADGLADLMDKLIILPSAERWEDGLTDLDVYQILQWDKELQKFYKLAYFKGEAFHKKEKFAYNWWRKTYKMPVFEEDSPEKVYGTYTDEFSEWINECQKEYDRILDEMSERDAEKAKKKEEYEENLKKFRTGMDNLGDRIKGAVLSWKTLIKWTKRVVGLIVTGALLVATYFVVNYMGRGVLWLVDNWDWTIFLIVILAIAGLATGALIMHLLKMWADYIESKGAMNVWYTKGLYYLILGVFLPFKWIFYSFLWKWVLVNIWYLIKRGARLVWGSLLGFLGIFGEYFGASYTDYCPGIEWEEDE